MPVPDCTILAELLQRFSDSRSLNTIANSLIELRDNDRAEIPHETLLQLYQKAIPAIEQRLWIEHADDNLLTLYQGLFREMEAHISASGRDERHDFVIVIPVADRPSHLRSCIQSIFTLCERFAYGGVHDGRYRKISVLIADDSKEQQSIRENRKIAEAYRDRGLDTLYFGQQQQLEQLGRLDSEQQAELSGILGEINPAHFYHKGASITRNISYLKLNELTRDKERLLFYFIDSDQEFKVNIAAKDGDRDAYAVNYFYHLDRIFSQTGTRILTGKVVGDPPVSPAVMIGNFLEDVGAFLSSMAKLDPAAACKFHNNRRQMDDASYHDMAELFGFKPEGAFNAYSCSLSGPHSQVDCYREFCRKINRFFDGEHPTRKSYYEHADISASIQPARTVYTGNYVFTADCLRYFIPFAPLKLRMAGPVLGRIIKAELGERFVSANLPMLHGRTVEHIGQSEFRPGIDRQHDTVDLSGEFERQFFGDVMLFTMEKLTAAGYPGTALNDELITDTMHETRLLLSDKYRLKHLQVIDKLITLYSLFEDQQAWWNKTAGLHAANHELALFLKNVEFNFGVDARGYNTINSQPHIDARTEQMLQAIKHYSHNRLLWHNVLSIPN